MKIHLISYLFHPDSLGGGALYTDFARFMTERGHDVRVTTTFSFYPQYRYSASDRKSPQRDEEFEGIPIRRIGMTLPRQYKGWRRIIPEVTFWLALRRRARFSEWQPDVVVAGCPMMAQSLAARGTYGPRIPLIVVVQDLMADAAAKLGIIRARFFLKALARVERHALRSANRLVTISEEMRARLEQLLAREVEVFPNWVHESLAVEASRVEKAGLDRKPGTLFYSGNLGVKQGLPEFLPDFFALAGDWKLEVHGDGPAADQLHAIHRQSPRFELKPLLVESAYVRALGQASVCLITQRAGAGDSFLPSKLLPALATGTPVLAVCDQESPLGREVTGSGIGHVVTPGDRAGLEAVLRKWREDPTELARLGRKARERSCAFRREVILGRYEQLLAGLCHDGRPL